jgi:two-component system OmpR family response regulator
VDQGHAVNLLHDGQAGLDFLLQEDTDIIVLDINLPTVDGLTVLQRLRKSKIMTPVILLTARGEVTDRVRGLDAGADDYLVKPFEMDELDARIRAISRRKSKFEGERVEFGELTYDKSTRQLFANDQNISLPRRELAVFECLFDRQNTLVTKSQLADFVYGVGADVDEKVVEVYVSRLRKKLADYDVVIRSARGLGYMMDLPK